MSNKPFTPAVSEMLGNSFDAALKARHELTHLVADNDTPFDTDKYHELSEDLNAATQAFYQQLWSATQDELTQRIVTEYVPSTAQARAVNARFRDVETVKAEVLDEPPTDTQWLNTEKGL